MDHSRNMATNPSAEHGHKHDRGRRPRSKAHQSHRRNSSESRELEVSDMGQGNSAVADSSPRPTKTKSRSPPKSSDKQLPSLNTAQIERNGSICKSPTWSPRGSLAARRQAEKERREMERQQRREADEAKKRLKEGHEEPNDGASSNSKRQSRRLVKRAPPPAAMETQRMPAALRTENKPVQTSTRQRRSSSLSSVMRFVTGGRSSSKARGGGETTDDEAYMSDASVMSRSSFIGGVKLKNAQTAEKQGPRIEESAIRRDSTDFGAQMQAQMDSITNRHSIDSVVVTEKKQPRASSSSLDNPRGSRSPPSDKRGRRKKTEGTQQIENTSPQEPEAPDDALAEDKVQAETNTQTLPKASRMDSVRAASMNRMQNLVTPLRSAMKGGRETAAAGKAQTMPTFTATGQKTTAQQNTTPSTNVNNYVQRARNHVQSRSLAGWRDEMAVEKAVTEAQAAYGPQMPPTPDASIDNLAKPPKQREEKLQQKMPVELPGSEPEASPTTPLTPGDADQVVWKQPIKANKQAAAVRVEKLKGQKDVKESGKEPVTDIDTLPSQKPRQTSNSYALKPAVPGDVSEQERKVSGDEEASLPSPEAGSDLPADLQDHGLRRQPAVMSWKVEKDKYGKVFSSSPRSPTSPTVNPFSPIEATLPPEQHPSLMALRADPDASRSRSESMLRVVNTDEPDIGEIGATIDRPFSIVPTPVASPMPGDLISMAPPRQVKTPGPLRRHSTPVEAIEEARNGPKEDTKATEKPVFPFPDRHKTLKKPEKRDADKSDASSSRQDSDKDNAPQQNGKAGASKVTFHTPPESPHHLAMPTSYDAYRRPYSKVSPGLAALDVEDDVELPVPVAQLGKPNPPFAQEAKATRGRRSRESSSSPRRASRSRNDGYVYLPFSPSASSSSVNLANKPKGFKFKNPDGTKAMDFAAKVFVICCSCRKWHDIPSSLYKEMSQGLREIDAKQDGVAEVRPPKHGGGGERGTSAERKKRRSKRGAVLTTVPCCWCDHEMSTMCCEGWTTVCFKHSQHHAIEGRDEAAAPAAAATSSPRMRASKRT